jgi:CRISPR-associated protein Cas2
MAKVITQKEEKIGPAVRNRRQWTVVSYDISDDRRRTKVMKTLEGYGQRAQYSVFECDLRPPDLARLEAKLRAIIEDESDDIRIYLLCEACVGKVRTLGRASIHREVGFRVVESAGKGR